MAWGVIPTGAAVADEPAPIALRVTWGGGEAAVWRGSIRIKPDEGGAERGAMLRTRSLSSDVDANASFHVAGAAIVVHPPSARSFDGVDLVVENWTGASLVVELTRDGRDGPRATLELPIADVLSGTRQQPLDAEGNRLTVRRVPGDAIQVRFHDAAGPGNRPGAGVGAARTPGAVRKPGEVVRLWVRPAVEARAATAAEYELRMRLVASGKQVFSDAAALVKLDVKGGPLAPFGEVPIDVPLPAREGVYELQLEVFDRGSLRWSRSIASRSVQMVAVGATPPAASPTAMELVYELDPGSPKLLDRLRRLPGVAVPSVAMPAVPVPAIPVPAIPVPQLPLPAMPLPAMPRFAAVESLMPRGGGLLSVGSSTLEVHPLGPVLRLPPAESPGEIAWEGIAIPVTTVGIPHVVEVEYPTDQQAAVAVAVVEPSASGGLGVVCCEGGFRVDPPAYGAEPARMEVHRFVFWPKTRSPVVVIANPSSRRPASVGRVRVLAGPDRLPAGDRAAAAVASTANRRAVYGFLPTPDFARFGTSERLDPQSIRPVHDWEGFFLGATRCVERLRAQGADGAMIGVHCDGASVWPSAHGLQGPRWDGGVFSETGADPEPKHLLELLSRVFEREGLGLVAAVECAGPLAGLESLIGRGSTDTAGIECVGRDGRAVSAGRPVKGRHYNILDPRVQEAVAGLVGELADAVAGSRAVRGVAVLLRHDGWMHLPAVAAPLDDVTMDRFARATGLEVPGGGPERFARRAAFVEGPARAAWLDWRAGEIAAFHARLAGLVAKSRGSLELHVVPTTLLSEGPTAARLRPVLAGEAEDGAVLLELGIDPARIAAARGVVFVSPHVRDAGEDVVAAATLDRGNNSLAVIREYAKLPRRGAILLERPMRADLRDVARALGVAVASQDGAAAALHLIPAGAERVRPLAESLVASDVERVFDESLLLDMAPSRVGEAMRSLTSIPPVALHTLERLPAPLVVRVGGDGGTTWISMVNASAAACTATVAVDGAFNAISDAARRSAVEAGGADGRVGWTVPLAPWEVRSFEATGAGRVAGVSVAHGEAVRQAVAARLASLRRRRAALETPSPMPVLDNPAFELPAAGASIPGWELVEAARGSVEIRSDAAPERRRSLCFSSEHGLSTLQSNPFAPPRTGRLSVAAWLKLDGESPQPPLRIAVEGRELDRQYYRFAPVGVGPGSMPLKPEWSQVVLQIDDFPTSGVEQIRVRFDLLGPGRVLIDDVRVFDLAFEESQRVQLSKKLALADHHLASGSLGACVVELDGHWPRFLHDFVEEKPAAAPAESRPLADAEAETKEAEKVSPLRAGVLERMRRWWQ